MLAIARQFNMLDIPTPSRLRGQKEVGNGMHPLCVTLFYATEEKINERTGFR